jgi:hypothetical protein
MARPISETTTFILSLPLTLPAKEVLANAKARGIKTSENNVHRVRRIHGRSKQAIAKALTSATAKAPAKVEAGSNNSAVAPTKSDFVRSFPLNAPAKQIVQKATAAGIDLDVRYVHKVQSRSKPAAARKTPATARPQRTHATSARSTVASVKHVSPRLSSSVEGLLRAIAAEIGFGRAVEILQGERASVRAVLGHWPDPRS